MKKILVVFGTRPEAIKMAPLVLAMMSQKRDFEVIVCVTGQHRELLDQVLKIFEIEPSIDLNLMTPNQELADTTSSILIGMRNVLQTVNPEIVLVHGDTTTTLATSLACFYSGTTLGHVEAGLRTHDLHSPFPEEFNRRVVSLLADIHFAPTEICRSNLLAEGVDSTKIHVTGNTVIDALHLTLAKIKDNAILKKSITEELNSKLGFKWELEKFVLITGHRRENFGIGFQEICFALSDLSEKYPEIRFVYPVHLNPNVQNPVRKILGKNKNIALVEPLDYISFSLLLQNCFFVLTDSGGIQEEAPSLGKPVLLMRETTERPEGIAAGAVELVGAVRAQILTSVSRLIEDENLYFKMAHSINPFGSGDSVERILSCLK